MADDYDRQWTALAQKLLRLLLPDRKLGCLCLRCMEDEIADAEQRELETKATEAVNHG